MVFHFLGTIVPLCAPYILAGVIFEIKKGTRVLTHSPNARHQRCQSRRYQPLSECALTSGSRRQCDQHQLCEPSSHPVFTALRCVAVQIYLYRTQVLKRHECPRIPLTLTANTKVGVPKYQWCLGYRGSRPLFLLVGRRRIELGLSFLFKLLL